MDFIKRYYEKILLGLVLFVFLVGAGLYYSVRLKPADTAEDDMQNVEKTKTGTVFGTVIIDPENPELLPDLKSTPKEIIEQSSQLALVSKEDVGMMEPPPYIQCTNPDCGKAFAFDVPMDKCPFCGTKQKEKPPAVQEGQDSDKDGLPDAWEQKNGLNANNPDDALEDKDQDGFSNLEEYREGTNIAAAADRPPMIALLRVDKVVPIYQPFILRKLTKSFTDPENKDKWTAKVDFYLNDAKALAIAGGTPPVYPEAAALYKQVTLKLGDVINADLKGYGTGKAKYPGGEFSLRGLEDRGKKKIEVESGGTGKKTEKLVDDISMTLADKAGKTWEFPFETLVPTGKMAVSFIYLSDRYDNKKCARIPFVRETDAKASIRVPPDTSTIGGPGRTPARMPLPPLPEDGALPGAGLGEEFFLSKIEKNAENTYIVYLLPKGAPENEPPIEIPFFDAKKDVLPKPKGLTPGSPGGPMPPMSPMPMRVPSRG